MYLFWTNGQEFNEWFSLKKYSPAIFNNNIKNIETNMIETDADNLWKEFHVGDFIIPLPHHHPVFTVTPQIKFMGVNAQPLFGFEYLNSKQKKLASFTIAPLVKFKLHDEGQRLFKVPFFKNYLEKFPDKQIWEDMFLKKITFDKNISIYEMIYNLNLMSQRSHFFPDKVKTFSYIPEYQFAIVEVPYENKDYKQEIFYKLTGSLLQTFVLITRIEDFEAKLVRNRIIKNIKFQQGSESIAKIIYDEFKKLNYHDQIDEVGMLYLLSAWSHWTDNKDFLRVIIQFLERGKDNFVRLAPLYSYAYNKFGTNFSSSEQILKENVNEEFKRKLKEEQDKSLKEAMERAILEPNLDNLSPEERINYRLKKAKDNKHNEEDDKVIVVD